MNAIEVVQRSNKAYNAHNADALAALYAEDVTYSHPRAGQGTGKAIVNFAKTVWAAYPDDPGKIFSLNSRHLGSVGPAGRRSHSCCQSS